MFRPNYNDQVQFKSVLKYANIRPESTILQFGVASGNTLMAILDVLRTEGRLPKQVFGFDSFEGLPAEAEGVNKISEWQEGAFNLVYELERNHHFLNMTREKGVQLVAERFRPYTTRVELVQGWYSDLNETHVNKYGIEVADFIDMDADLYISTMQAWDFIAKFELMRDGCLVRYDDWQNDCSIGEDRAHLEVEDKYNWKFQEIYGCGKKLFKFMGTK